MLQELDIIQIYDILNYIYTFRSKLRVAYLNGFVQPMEAPFVEGIPHNRETRCYILYLYTMRFPLELLYYEVFCIQCGTGDSLPDKIKYHGFYFRD